MSIAPAGRRPRSPAISRALTTIRKTMIWGRSPCGSRYQGDEVDRRHRRGVELVGIHGARAGGAARPARRRGRHRRDDHRSPRRRWSRAASASGWRSASPGLGWGELRLESARGWPVGVGGGRGGGWETPFADGSVAELDEPRSCRRPRSGGDGLGAGRQRRERHRGLPEAVDGDRLRLGPVHGEGDRPGGGEAGGGMIDGRGDDQRLALGGGVERGGHRQRRRRRPPAGRSPRRTDDEVADVYQASAVASGWYSAVIDG